MRPQLRLNKKNLKVKNLLPLQKEISLKKIIKLFSKIESFNPIITLNSKYIIDGHHRWASVYSLDPESYIRCININLSIDPEQILDKFKALYKSTIKSNKHNIFNLSRFNLNKKLDSDYNKKAISNNLNRLVKNNRPVPGAKDQLLVFLKFIYLYTNILRT